MGRPALAATSLVAAVPAGLLAYVTIMAFVRYADAMPTGMLVVNGVGVALAVLLAITPIVILVGGRADKKDKPAAESAEGSPEADAAESAAHTAEVVADDPDLDEFPDGTDGDEMEGTAETDSFEFDMDEMEDSPGAADDAFEFDDDEFK